MPTVTLAASLILLLLHLIILTQHLLTITITLINLSIHYNSEAWSFGPQWYIPLIALPYVISGYGFGAGWVLPLAAILIGYMQHKKDKADAAVAIGVVTDAKVSHYTCGYSS
jgi:hypothetical protein